MGLVLLHLLLVHLMNYAVRLASPRIQLLWVYHDVPVDNRVQHVLLPLGLIFLLLLPLLVGAGGPRRKQRTLVPLF